jgi:leucyl aminopeptidase
MQVTILSEKITRIRSEVLILGFFQDIRPLTGYAAEIDWFTNGAISSLIQQNKINGALGEATLLATSKVLTPKILLVGLGQKRDYSYKILQQLSTHVLEILARLKVREAIAELWGQEECSLDLVCCLDVFLQGCMASPCFQSQVESTGEAPTLMTLLTHQSDRIKELTHRVREYERTQTLPPSNLGGLSGPSQGLGTLRVETKR